MKTGDLIETLSADATPPPALRRTLLLALGASAVLAGIVWLAMLGPRPDFMPALHTVRFVFKFIFALVLAGTAALVAFPMAQPFDRPSRLRPLLLAGPLLLLAAVVAELAMIPSSDWMRLWMGHNAVVCMLSIPAIAAAPLAVMLFALREGAPARRTRRCDRRPDRWRPRRLLLCGALLRRLAPVRRHLVHARDWFRDRHRRLAWRPTPALVASP